VQFHCPVCGRLSEKPTATPVMCRPCCRSYDRLEERKATPEEFYKWGKRRRQHWLATTNKT
jgi:hypothetical protein